MEARSAAERISASDLTYSSLVLGRARAWLLDAMITASGVRISCAASARNPCWSPIARRKGATARPLSTAPSTAQAASRPSDSSSVRTSSAPSSSSRSSDDAIVMNPRASEIGRTNPR